VEVPQEMYYISSVVKIISMNLNSKAGVSKNIVLAKISAFKFLPTPALGCNLSALVFWRHLVFRYFCQHYPTMLDWRRRRNRRRRRRKRRIIWRMNDQI
jgi:hypothetical protein